MVFFNALFSVFYQCLPIVALIVLCWLCVFVPQEWQRKHWQLVKQAIKPGVLITTFNGTSGTVLDIQGSLIRMMCTDGTLKQVNTNTVIGVGNEKK